MKKEIKNRWIAELRSNKYNKGKNLLSYYNKETGKVYHCALGVLCEVVKLPKRENHLDNIISYQYEFDTALGKNWYSNMIFDIELLKIDIQEQIVLLNDKEDWELSELADYIEDNIPIT